MDLWPCGEKKINGRHKYFGGEKSKTAATHPPPLKSTLTPYLNLSLPPPSLSPSHSCPQAPLTTGIMKKVSFAMNSNYIGGGVASGPYSQISITDSRFIGNEAYGTCAFHKTVEHCVGTGGGLAIFGKANIVRTKFLSNSAGAAGGGLYYCPFVNDSVLSIDTSSFYRNWAGDAGRWE